MCSGAKSALAAVGQIFAWLSQNWTVGWALHHNKAESSQCEPVNARFFYLNQYRQISNYHCNHYMHPTFTNLGNSTQLSLFGFFFCVSSRYIHTKGIHSQNLNILGLVRLLFNKQKLTLRQRVAKTGSTTVDCLTGSKTQKTCLKWQRNAVQSVCLQLQKEVRNTVSSSLAFSENHCTVIV